MKYALVTGCDHGVGLALAEQLVQRNYTVAACRFNENESQLDSLAANHPGQMTILPLDTSSDPSFLWLLLMLLHADAHGGRDAWHLLSPRPHQDRRTSNPLCSAGIGMPTGIGGYVGGVQSAQSAQAGERQVYPDGLQKRPSVQGGECGRREQVGHAVRVSGEKVRIGR